MTDLIPHKEQLPTDEGLVIDVQPTTVVKAVAVGQVSTELRPDWEGGQLEIAVQGGRSPIAAMTVCVRTGHVTIINADDACRRHLVTRTC